MTDPVAANGRTDEALHGWQRARELYAASGVAAGVEESDAHLRLLA